MGRLAIRKVEYSGEKYEFASPELPDGLVVVEGDNRTGKSTFADLIFFGLGGPVKQFAKKGKEQHKEITSDVKNAVHVTVDLNGERFRVTRRFDAPQDILIAAHGDLSEVEVLPVHRHEGRRVFSDWLLEKLGIRSVTLFVGSYNGKLNLTDLMRLMYHDQDPDPARVFMRPDRESFVADSLDFRRAIFEILIGTTSEKFYESLGKLRMAERTHAERQATLDVYKNAVGQLTPHADTNAVFLEKQIKDHEAQLERLAASRRQARKTNPTAPSPESDLMNMRRDLAAHEVKLGALERVRSDLVTERVRLISLEGQLIDEVLRIQKIIHAHETLALFSPDTCPCCLRPVARAQAACICGQPVEEDAYQRFFYSSDEYLSILKSKQKNVQTVREARAGCELELAGLEKRVVGVQAASDEVRKRMERWGGSHGTYGTLLEQIDDKIVDVRVELERLKQQLDLEFARNKLEQALAAAREELERLRIETQKLELDAQADRVAKIARFNAIYTELMADTLEDVRTVRLDADYEPILNGGEYREASSRVPRRLMYFLTLLSLSLESDIPFPRFLLIDTPETAGIDRENLSRAIGKIAAVLEKGTGQVILTTGPDRYPNQMQSKRFVTLTQKEKLLRPQRTRAMT